MQAFVAVTAKSLQVAEFVIVGIFIQVMHNFRLGRYSALLATFTKRILAQKKAA